MIPSPYKHCIILAVIQEMDLLSMEME